MILHRSWEVEVSRTLSDGLHRCIYSSIETDRIVGTGDIKVNRSRKTDRVDSESGKFSGTAEGTVSSDYNDTIDTMFLTYLSAALLAFLSREFSQRAV